MTAMPLLLDHYERFCAALAHVRGLDVEVSLVKTSTTADVAALEKALDVIIADDLRCFWIRGFHNVSIQLGTRVVASTAFVTARGALQQANDARDRLARAPAVQDPAIARFLRTGIPLQWNESYCFVDGGVLGRGRIRQLRLDGQPMGPSIAPTFAAFFEHWLGAGCISSGFSDANEFKDYWWRIAQLLEVKIAPAQNEWLKHVGRFNGNPKFPVSTPFQASPPSASA